MYLAHTQKSHSLKHLLFDSSIKASGAVAYLQVVQEDGKVEVGFVMAKAKVAPQSEPTIPRLELCAAVLAAEMAGFIQEELDLKLDAIKFYTDSKVVLRYSCNETRRFYVYVHNRVQRIHQFSKPEQWHYVWTDENPADHALRSLPVSRLAQSSWPNREGKCRGWHRCLQPHTFDEMEQAKKVILKATQKNCQLSKLVNQCSKAVPCKNSAHLWRKDSSVLEID